MVDLDKFICSLLNHSIGILDPFSRIYDALAEQGLEYKDGAIKPIEKEGKPVIIDAGFGSLTVHFNEEEMEAFKEVLKKKPEAEKPSTIKFNEESAEKKRYFLKIDDYSDELRSKVKGLLTVNGPDIDAMVEDFWHNKDVIISSHTRGMVEEAYRQGLEDMYKRLKG